MSGRDVGASVRQRLLNRARSEGRPFQELLQYFAMERFLYRLAKSLFVDRFILKGALLLTAWRAPVTRPTIDIDLAGRTSNELDHIRSVVAELCQLNVEPDGLEFDPASIEVRRIKEDADYEGVRVRFSATLAKARIPMQIDIGFGDVIVPKPINVEYPAMLEFPPPLLRAYPKETVVAEKLEALTLLGMLNSRIKDYYDVALLARMYSFGGALLVEAIRSTFLHRGTAAEASPVGLTEAFSSDPARAIQWRAFVRRSRLGPEWELEEIVDQVRLFASAPLAAVAEDRPFDLDWRPGGPWA
ncbi:MAG: nucleotidyl transferase AbiEii/AbiGii toxin family protein [Bryobacteraceae bacterium]|nr:nucleotidyl transferase AbiEii/AbiGii toxin family protein [Bryobacteraceae bacterium]